jgi:hypothetical protein
MGLDCSETPAVRQVPKPNGRVVAGADEHLAVRCDSKRAHPGRVAFQRPLLCYMGHVKQLDRLITASGDQELGIGGKGYRADPIVHRFLKSAVIFDEVPARFTGIVVMLFPVSVMQDFFFSAGQHFPELDLADIRSAGEVYPVRRKGDTDRPVVVVLVLAEESHEFSAGGHLPNLDVFVVAAARQHETVWRERETDDIVVIACEEELLRFAGVRIPQPDGTVLAGSGQGLAVRREEDGSDIRGVPPERSQKAPGFNVPLTDEPIDSAAGEGQAVRRKDDRPDSVRMAAKGRQLPCRCLPVFEEIDGSGACSYRCRCERGRNGGKLGCGLIGHVQSSLLMGYVYVDCRDGVDCQPAVLPSIIGFGLRKIVREASLSSQAGSESRFAFPLPDVPAR